MAHLDNVTVTKYFYIRIKKKSSCIHLFCLTLESTKTTDFMSQAEELILKKTLQMDAKQLLRDADASEVSPAALGEVVQHNSPGLPVHALHPELLPA